MWLQAQPSTSTPPGIEETLVRGSWSQVSWWLAVIVTMAAAVVPVVWWIGDVSFIQDEPRLLAKAYHANAAGQLESRGLNGNFGIPYGPLPTQIYQVLLHVTHDPITLAGIRAGLCAGITAIGLLWLAWALRLNPWFATAVVLAPYVWNFHRIMWDASFAIPIGVMALAAYASFLRTRSRWALFTAILCVLCLAFIHPQDAPLLTPIGLHMLWTQRPALARHYVGVALILGIVFALNFGYFKRAYDAASWARHEGVLKKGYPGNNKSKAESMLNAFRGGSMLEGSRFAARDSQLRNPPWLVAAAQAGSRTVYVLIWVGILVAAVRLILRITSRPDGEDDDLDDPTLRSARRALFGIALTGVLLQMLICGVMRIPPEPQYYFGTFGIHVLLAWIAVDAMARFFRLDWAIIAVYGVSVAYITIASLIHVHHVGYARGTFRPALSNQVQVARGLNRYADPTVYTDVQMYQAFPQAIRSLRLFILPEPGKAQLPGKQLLIRNRTGLAGTDCAVELVELSPGETLDARFEPLDVTPLPPDWQPSKW
jgi:hypothetical protein